MTNYKYMKINIKDIPQEVIDEYNLLEYVHSSWVYMEIRRRAYGLPQARKLSNNLLATRLEAAGYIHAKTTLGFWSHKTRLIRFCLVVDNFGIEYVGEENTRHLINTLKQYYNIEDNWDSNSFLNINLDWDYKHCTC